MKTFKRWLLISLLSLMGLPAHADILVLVHGYLGSAHSWDTSGISRVLSSAGWQYHGVLLHSPMGAQFVPIEEKEAEDRFYSVELPSQAPVMLQAHLLNEMLTKVSQLNPNQPITIAAHSAGGVVARTTLVVAKPTSVNRLISIASPHLGTQRAAQALDVTDVPFPLSVAQDILTDGRTHVVRTSRGLLIDLLPAHPGSFLYWLNAQQHPDIAYHSIVRTGPVGLGDQLVPLFSQDMNNLPALATRSNTQRVATDHALVADDGRTILEILSN